MLDHVYLANLNFGGRCGLGRHVVQAAGVRPVVILRMLAHLFAEDIPLLGPSPFSKKFANGGSREIIGLKRKVESLV